MTDRSEDEGDRHTQSYYCPRCGTIAELERDAYLADKAVTPYPLEGWAYASPEEDYESADGVRFVCGESETPRLSFHPAERDPRETHASNGAGTGTETGTETETRMPTGCGEPFYLSFIRFEDGEEVEPRPPQEYVEIGVRTGPWGPQMPDGPSGPR